MNAAAYDVRTLSSPIGVNRKPIARVVWACPTCGYWITDVMMLSFRCDVGCPHCWNTLGNFKPFDFKEARWINQT